MNWKEALPMFVDVIHTLASDQRDHFVSIIAFFFSKLCFFCIFTSLIFLPQISTNFQIGLLDKQTGYLYWYNLRDKTSQWMSEEDQAHYGPGCRSSQ